MNHHPADPEGVEDLLHLVLLLTLFLLADQSYLVGLVVVPVPRFDPVPSPV